MKQVIALVGSVLLLVSLASVAFAHAQIIRCTPEIGGTVATAPSTVTCKASESMDAKGSSLAVFDASGMQVDKKDSAVDLNDPDRVTMTVSLDTAMVKDGTYTVKWTTLSSADGDSAEGEFQFAVGAQPVKLDPTGTPAPEGDEQVTPLPAGTIKIVSPADKATLPAGKTEIKIALTGVELGDKYHWHIMLDGNMVTMIVNKADSAVIELTAGEHEIVATLADDAHTDLAADTVHVTVQGTGSEAQATTAATAEATHEMEMGTATTEATHEMEMGTATPIVQAPAEATTAPTEAMHMGTASPAAEATVAQATAAPTEMQMSTETPAAQPTATGAVPTAAPTVTPETTLPGTGEGVNYGLVALIAVAGLVVLGAGALVAVRTRR